MSKLIMGIGIPGSGKTTALKPFAEQNAYAYLCPDDIRIELTGNSADQSRNREVWAEAHKRVAHALENGETIVFDATFARDSERKNFIAFGHGYFSAEKFRYPDSARQPPSLKCSVHSHSNLGHFR
jgi:predicted kinase